MLLGFEFLAAGARQAQEAVGLGLESRAGNRPQLGARADALAAGSRIDIGRTGDGARLVEAFVSRFHTGLTCRVLHLRLV